MNSRTPAQPLKLKLQGLALKHSRTIADAVEELQALGRDRGAIETRDAAAVAALSCGSLTCLV